MSIRDSEKFYGRKPVLDLLKRRVLDLKDGYRQNLAFLGERYIGKSLILRKFISELDDPQTATVYLDLEGVDLSDLCSRLIGSLLYYYSSRQKLPLHEDLYLLLQSTQTQLPITNKASRKILSLLAHGRKAEAYLELIALPQIFAREADSFCLLVFDEFSHLEDIVGLEAFQELGKKIMTQKRCLYVMASSLPVPAKKILSEKLSLLFGNFELIEIEPFDLQTCREFLSVCLRDVQIKEKYQKFLIDFTAGHPLYLQIVCRELIRISALHQQGEIFSPLLCRAIENVLFDRWGILGRHFELLVNSWSNGKGQIVMPRLLTALAEGKQKVKELARATELKQGQVSQRLARLVEAGLVVKNGGYYLLRDKLLRYWLKYVFERKRSVVALDPLRQRQAFQEELKTSLETFIVDSQKELPARIMELLACFENESFFINGRRYKLPLFRRIEPRRSSQGTPAGFDVIKASAPEGDWVFALKEDMISENDVAVFMKKAKKMASKPQRCILISMSRLDESVRVRALAERMWIWNEGELNTLLNLYDKSFIVV